MKIGGLGKIVEVDKSFDRGKYNRGRYRCGHWVFGVVESGSGNVFMVEVPDRIARTLLPIIQNYVSPGTRYHCNVRRVEVTHQITTLGMSH